MTGFKTLALSNIELGVDQRVRIDLKLEVGAMTESVSVDGRRRRCVQTSSSELGTTVSDEQIEALPLNGRNFVNLTRTVPGRPARHPRREHRRRRQPGLARLGVVLGQRPARRATTTTCSTASTTTRPGCRRSCIFPSVDALDEFKLQT